MNNIIFFFATSNITDKQNTFEDYFACISTTATTNIISTVNEFVITRVLSAVNGAEEGG